MVSLGLVGSLSQPGVYIHEAKGIKVTIHVDDFLCTGQKDSLEWFKAELSKLFELKAEFDK